MIETDVAMKLKETQARLGQILQQKINEYDLNIGLLHLAILVEKYPNASQKELAGKMRFTEGAMSTAVKRLIKLNILEQIPLETDLRYNRLIVTKKGNCLIKDYKEYIFQVYKDIFLGFEDDELKILDNFLEKINANLEIINNKYNKTE